jgi:peptide/nickel transport system permease protein
VKKETNIVKYMVRRLIQVVPTIVGASLVLFALIHALPGDPVEAIMERDGYDLDKVSDARSYELEYQRIATKYGLDKPSFYLSVDRQSAQGWHYPSLTYHGLDNQYHQWLLGLVSGRATVSAISGESVNTSIYRAIGWSLSLAVLAIFLICLIGIPLGLALHQYRLPGVEQGLLFIHSLPAFWLAILLVVFFTTAEYGRWTDILPSPGIWADDLTFWQGLVSDGKRLMIPLLVLVVKDLAFMTQLVKATADKEVTLPYSTTARAKGLSTSEQTSRHILPNTLLPITTVIIDALPRAIAGLLLLEIICNIPGMGRLLYGAIVEQDYNVVLHITMIIAAITSLMYIVGDIIYAWINPKISLQ